MKKVLIASTYLHLLDSLILKHQFADNFYLVFIGKENLFLENIKSLFDNFLLLNEDKDNKFTQRVKNAKILLEFIENISPDEIIVGNDRKIETSILIANYNSNYSYMDDGLHSYILEKQHLFKYTFLEKQLKQFLYKNRLVLPKYIGSAEYIKKAYLFRPNLAHKFLKNKTLIKLTPDTQKLKNIFSPMVDTQLKNQLKTASKLFFLPHPKFIDDVKLNIIKNLIDENSFVKLHPRDNQTKLNANILPNELFSEMIFPFINCKVYGFNTTALLTAKWLRDDLEVFNIGKTDNFMLENGIKEYEGK